MALPSNSKPQHVHNLPLEVVQNVLGFLPDIESVTNASMSCWRWQNALRTFEDQILQKVLCRELGDLHDLSVHAIEALQIPRNQNFTDLAKILSFMSPSQPWISNPDRETLLCHIQVVREIKAANGLAATEDDRPEQKKFDPIKGPYNLKKALEITQTCQAHRKLADEFFATQNLMFTDDSHRPTRSQIETALWKIEAFGRLFGGQLWYERWHSSYCFYIIIEAYWESFVDEDFEWIFETHTFLVDIIQKALPGGNKTRPSSGAARDPRTCCQFKPFCHGCSEGVIATGLVGIFAHCNNDDDMPIPVPHHFFLSGFWLHGGSRIW